MEVEGNKGEDEMIIGTKNNGKTLLDVLKEENLALKNNIEYLGSLHELDRKKIEKLEEQLKTVFGVNKIKDAETLLLKLDAEIKADELNKLPSLGGLGSLLSDGILEWDIQTHSH